MDNQKDISVLTIIRKNILNKNFIYNQKNLVGHLYYLVLNIKELYL